MTWREVLAAETAATSQARVGRRIGYAASVVSQVLSGTYRGDLTKVRAAVEGGLMAATVDCPVLGPIGTQKCLGHQRRPLDPTTPERVRLWKACRSGCIHSRLSPVAPAFAKPASVGEGRSAKGDPPTQETG